MNKHIHIHFKHGDIFYPEKILVKHIKGMLCAAKEHLKKIQFLGEHFDLLSKLGGY